MHDEGTDSKVKVFANIFISFIGAGILGLPYAFREAGLIEGIVTMSVVGVVSVKAMLLLIDCKDHMLLSQSLASLTSNAKEGDRKKEVGNGSFIDYGDVGERALGKIGKVVVEIMIVVSQIGFCCAYLIFVSENLHSILPLCPKIVYLFTLLVPLVFLSNLRSLNNLAPFSLAADFANIFAYGIVFYFDMDHFHLLHFHITNFSIEGFPFFLGIAIYCFEGAGLIMSLEASTAKEIRSSFRSIFKLAIFSTTVLYLLFGICGYLSFGPETNSIITLNLPLGLFPFIVKGCLCFSLFFTYPIMLFPVTNILERLLCSRTEKNGKDYFLGVVLRTSLVVVTGLIVLAIPNFSTLMALVGCSCCMFLAFILPGLFHWLIFRGNLTMWSMVMDILLIIVGIVGSIIGLRDALIRLTDHSATTSKVALDITSDMLGWDNPLTTPLPPHLPLPTWSSFNDSMHS